MKGIKFIASNNTGSMEKKLQNNIGFLFIGIFLCAVIGFHKTYTIHFPAFTGFHWQQHFHGAMLMSWFLMLIIQPFLIRYKKKISIEGWANWVTYWRH